MVFPFLFQDSYPSIEENGSLVVVYFGGIRTRYRYSDHDTVHRMPTYRPIDIVYVKTLVLVILLMADIYAVHCQSTPAFVRREHIFLYFTAASDLVTDVMRRQGK